MNYKNLIAAAVNLDIDYSIMSNELLSVMNHKSCVPFSYPLSKENTEQVTAHSLFLRQSAEHQDYSYRGAKHAGFDTWAWNQDLKIAYTKSIVESLPFKTLAAVRVVYFPSIPCVEHTDWDDPTDTMHTLGLSIIPSTAGVSCEVWNKSTKQYVSIPGNAMLLNDSIKHKVPKGLGTRITMRVFGEIDYSWFNDKIITDYCYYC
jgi:hypothetical protein